jgi:hypothetical protein
MDFAQNMAIWRLTAKWLGIAFIPALATQCHADKCRKEMQKME